MKTLLRVLSLGIALALSAFAMTTHANAYTLVNCSVRCVNHTTHTITSVTFYTTESDCCDTSSNPCPDGYTPGGRSFIPPGGVAEKCPLPV